MTDYISFRREINLTLLSHQYMLSSIHRDDNRYYQKVEYGLHPILINKLPNDLVYKIKLDDNGAQLICTQIHYAEILLGIIKGYTGKYIPAKNVYSHMLVKWLSREGYDSDVYDVVDAKRYVIFENQMIATKFHLEMG